MKLKKPIHIIQVFDNSYEYGKEEKSYETRKLKYAWLNSISSQNGFVERTILKTNSLKSKELNVLNCDFLILSDFNTNSEEETLNRFRHLKFSEQIKLQQASDNERIKLLQDFKNAIEYLVSGNFTQHPYQFKCFNIQQKENIEIHLNWNYWDIGIPERENFKICELQKNKPIEINVNGKRDFSMTGRRARTFVERNFIIEYLGTVSEIEETNNIFQKKIPTTKKRINLLKKLF